MSVHNVHFVIASVTLIAVIQMLSIQMTYSFTFVVAGPKVIQNVPDFPTKKGPMCHAPFVNEETGYLLNDSLIEKYSLLDFGKFKLVSWYYNETFKSCYPLYSRSGVHHYLGNFNLPKTKLECEDLCAEPCTMEDGSYGIFMSSVYCKQQDHHTSNLNYTMDDVKCCPRYSVSAHPIPTTSHIVQHPIIEISGDGEKIRKPWNIPPINYEE